MASIAAPAFAQKLKEDPSCAEVNYAYAATRSSWFYSERFYDLRKDGAGKQFGEQRFDDETAYYRTVGKPAWSRSQRANWSPRDDYGPRFQSCQFVAEREDLGDKIRQYRATWQRDGIVADIDVWFSSKGKRFVRAERRFKDPEYPNKTYGTTEGAILEVFDYNPKAAVAPKGPFEPD